MCTGRYRPRACINAFVLIRFSPHAAVDYGIGGAIYCDFTRLRERNPEGENSLGLPLAVNYVSPDALAGGVHVDTDIALGFSPALHARSTWAALA